MPEPSRYTVTVPGGRIPYVVDIVGRASEPPLPLVINLNGDRRSYQDRRWIKFRLSPNLYGGPLVIANQMRTIVYNAPPRNLGFWFWPVYEESLYPVADPIGGFVVRYYPLRYLEVGEVLTFEVRKDDYGSLSFTGTVILVDNGEFEVEIVQPPTFTVESHRHAFAKQ